MKVCIRCKEEKLMADFNANSRQSDGRDIYCRECARLKLKAWRAENFEQYTQSRRTRLVKQWHKALWKSARKSASDRNLEFNLSPEDVLELYEEQGGRCFWFNLELKPSEVPRDPRQPSLDRLDNSKGYIMDNVVLTCLAANLGRCITPRSEWERFLELLREEI